MVSALETHLAYKEISINVLEIHSMQTDVEMSENIQNCLIIVITSRCFFVYLFLLCVYCTQVSYNLYH
jgi:hypothetical protein